MKHLRHLILGLTILCLVCTGNQVKAGNQNYETKTLPNGIRLIYKILPDSPTVTARFVFSVGFLDEPKELRGISHLIEHLIYRGNVRYTPDDFEKNITELGGEYNGSTWLDNTQYYMVVPSDYYLKALTIYSDLVLNPGLNENAVQLEKKIVMVEKAYRKLPGSIEWLYLSQLTDERFDWEVANIKRDDIVQYHQQYYHPNRMTLILTGAFRLNDVIDSLSKYQDRAKPASYDRPFLSQKFHPVDVDVRDYLQGEQYKLVFAFDLNRMSGKDLAIAKVLPYLLSYESGNYDNITNRSLEYGIWFLNYGDRYGLALFYRDCQDEYSPKIDAWHKKNLERYCKLLKAKNFERFLNQFTDVIGRSYQTIDSDSFSLNEYYFNLMYDPTFITEKDLNTIRNLHSSDFKNFVDKYLDGKSYHKIVVRAIQE